jgi:hypothetical protein
LLIGRLVTIRIRVRSLRVWLPLRVSPHPVAGAGSAILPHGERRLIRPRSEIVLRASAGACLGPGRFPWLHEVLKPMVWVKIRIPLTHVVDWPPTPLPFLWSVTHERALVAARGDEDIWPFASQGIFESAPAAGTLAVIWTSPVVFRAEVGQEPVALAPSSDGWVEFNAWLFAREATTWAIVVPSGKAFASEEVLLFDMVSEWRWHIHDCWVQGG